MRRCGGGGVPVAESAVAPPGPIPNPVVTHRSAGEYCRSDSVGGEAAAGTPRPRHRRDGRRRPPPAPCAQDGSTLELVHTQRTTRDAWPARGGAAAARWAHNPKVAGSNPAPATNLAQARTIQVRAFLCFLRTHVL